jgi:hypothetical protein
VSQFASGVLPIPDWGELRTGAASPDVVGGPDDERERKEKRNRQGRWRGRSEGGLQRRRVGERRCEDELEQDAPEQKPVRPQPGGTDRPPLYPGRTRPTYYKLSGARSALKDATIERRFKRYGDWAGLAFWLYLTQDWVEDGLPV